MKNNKLIEWILILICVGFLAYLPSLFGSFVWDDEDYVYNNQYVTEFSITKYFTQQAIAGRGKDSQYYRPLQLTLNGINHTLFGYSPFAYHLTNVVVHIGAAVTIFFFLFLVIGNLPISFLTTLFFLIHPIQTEAVSYISGLADPLVALWGFLTLIFFWKKERIWYLGISIGFFIFALLSKETGLLFLPLLIVLQILYKRRSYHSLIPYVMIAIIYGALHIGVTSNIDLAASWKGSPYGNSLLTRLLTFVQNFWFYLGLLVFPKDLYMERDLTLPLQTSPLNLYLLGFVTMICTVGVYLYQIWRQVEKRKTLLLLFLGIWITLFPTMGILLVNGIMYEHYLYIAIVFITSFILLVFKRYINTRMIIIISIVGVLLVIRSYVRQWEWIDPIRFYEQTLHYEPSSTRIQNNLAMAYAEHGEQDKAIPLYLEAIKKNPFTPNLYHNLANIYRDREEFTTAEAYYKKATVVSPQFYYSYVALLELYQKTKQGEQFSKTLQEIRTKFPYLELKQLDSNN
ncbi:tetratricopeptide repeat protein [bacterium]|nr:tetratricopeptide repeat protein [bacterium]